MLRLTGTPELLLIDELVGAELHPANKRRINPREREPKRRGLCILASLESKTLKRNPYCFFAVRAHNCTNTTVLLEQFLNQTWLLALAAGRISTSC
jgi:hypothetical protein